MRGKPLTGLVGLYGGCFLKAESENSYRLENFGAIQGMEHSFREKYCPNTIHKAYLFLTSSFKNRSDLTTEVTGKSGVFIFKFTTFWLPHMGNLSFQVHLLLKPFLRQRTLNDTWLPYYMAWYLNILKQWQALLAFNGSGNWTYKYLKKTSRALNLCLWNALLLSPCKRLLINWEHVGLKPLLSYTKWTPVYPTPLGIVVAQQAHWLTFSGHAPKSLLFGNQFTLS